MKRILLRLFSLSLIICISFVVFLYVVSFFKTPQSDREWGEEFEKITTVEDTEQNTLILKNVRDWTYGDELVIGKNWLDLEVDPKTIKRVWFLTEPFSGWKAIGHTFLSFEFEDGTTLSFSIEARRDSAEGYAAIDGMFNEYELAYMWGTERDFTTRRLLFLDHPLRRFPLDVTPEMAETLFRSFVHETNELAKQPRFYNTLTENCTNTLAEIVNEMKPGTLPYNIAWNLPGYADLYLMDEGFIPKVNDSEERTRNTYDLTPRKAEIFSIATSSPKNFSRELDRMLGEE
jgi:hypothetical protein